MRGAVCPACENTEATPGTLVSRKARGAKPPDRPTRRDVSTAVEVSEAANPGSNHAESSAAASSAAEIRVVRAVRATAAESATETTAPASPPESRARTEEAATGSRRTSAFGRVSCSRGEARGHCRSGSDSNVRALDIGPGRRVASARSERRESRRFTARRAKRRSRGVCRFWFFRCSPRGTRARKRAPEWVAAYLRRRLRRRPRVAVLETCSKDSICVI